MKAYRRIKAPLTLNWWIPATVLFIAALAAYWRILDDYPVADDFGHIAKLAHLKYYEVWEFFLVQSNYFIRPLPFYQMWLFHQLFGMNWIPAHLLNVIMHALIAVMLFRFMESAGAARKTAFFAAFLFALSPLSPEAVTWTAGRFDVWALSLVFASLLLYLRYIKERSPLAYAGSLALAALALLSKEAAVVLFAVIPALELLYGPLFDKDDGSSVLRRRLRRLAPFMMLLAGYLVLRLAVTGALMRTPSYMETAASPNVRAPLRTLFTMLAPFDRLVVDKPAYLVFGMYAGILFAAAFLLVACRWRQASVYARRLWVFLALFFVCSLVPVYSSVFIKGMGAHLNDSRFLYFANLAFLAMLPVGLLEFGWKRRKYQAVAVILIALMLPVYFWGLTMNNRAWSQAAEISRYIPEETRRLVPEPSPGDKFYYRYVPRMAGAHIFASALPISVPLQYGRTDLEIFYYEPDPVLERFFNDAGPPPPDAYLFEYDWETGKLNLVQRPH